MQGHIHAIALIVALVCPLAVTATNFSMPSRDSVRRALVCFAGFLLVGCVSALILTSNGKPLGQWLWPGISASVVCLVVHNERLRKAVHRGELGMACILCIHYLALVEKDYFGNVTLPKLEAARVNWFLQDVATELLTTAQDGLEYPAGLVKDVFPSVRKTSIHTSELESSWHTPITGLYSLRRMKLEAWFAGGTIEKNVLHDLKAVSANGNGEAKRSAVSAGNTKSYRTVWNHARM